MACIAAKSVEVKRYIPRVGSLVDGAEAGGFAAGVFLGDGEGERVGVGVAAVRVGEGDSAGIPDSDGLDLATALVGD